MSAPAVPTGVPSSSPRPLPPVLFPPSRLNSSSLTRSERAGERGGGEEKLEGESEKKRREEEEGERKEEEGERKEEGGGRKAKEGGSNEEEGRGSKEKEG
eukprot:281346-Rhodomonas_salina.1